MHAKRLADQAAGREQAGADQKKRHMYSHKFVGDPAFQNDVAAALLRKLEEKRGVRSRPTGPLARLWGADRAVVKR